MDNDSGTKGTPAKSEEEIKIEDLPNRETTAEESEAAKGGYYSGGTGGIISFGGFGGSLESTSRDTDLTKHEDPNDGTVTYDES